MNTLILDIETDSTWSKIWVVCCKWVGNKEVFKFKANQTLELQELIRQSERVVGHNIIGFDAYHLNRLWNVHISYPKLWDSLVVSRLLNPAQNFGHSLEDWGRSLGVLKQHWDKWDNLTDEEVEQISEYCAQDVVVTEKLYLKLINSIETKKFSEESVLLEFATQFIVQEQIRRGINFDIEGAVKLHKEVSDRVEATKEELQNKFEPNVIVLKTKTKVVPFNPGSRIQIIDRLKARGWVPTEFTEKGNVALDEDILKSIDIPEAKDFLDFFELQKIQGFLTNWIDKVTVFGRIHGSVITNGAITGRMTHSSPNLGQVPSVETELGRRCRELFLPDDGEVLVGIDASGLELRMLAHYMQDPAYIQEVAHGDVHTVNQHAAGLPTRSQAKTFIYAFLYGAGAEKIGSIVNGTAEEGRVLIEKFLNGVPALNRLREKIKKIAAKGSIPGLDGRRILIRQQYRALNTLLQGGGAIVMKRALVIFYDKLKAEKIPTKFLLNVHDEWQISVKKEFAETVGKLGVESIKEAGEYYKLRCPLTGEFKIGNNWAETH